MACCAREEDRNPEYRWVSLLDQHSLILFITAYNSLIILYLGVALTKRGGRDKEAISNFKKGFRHEARNNTGPRDTLWARAFFSRVLRRQGLVKQADEQEEWLRLRIRNHMPTGLSGRRELLPFLLDDGEETNSIVDRIGWDYFDAPEIRDTLTGSIYIPVRGGVLHTVCYYLPYPTALAFVHLHDTSWLRT